MATALSLSPPGFHLTLTNSKNALLQSRNWLQIRSWGLHSGFIRRVQTHGFGRGYETSGDSYFDGYDIMEEEEESDDDFEETDSSVDLLVKFLLSIYMKFSKRAKKASRTVLPSAMSPQLVSFAVDGFLLLASLSIVKAFLQVICTLGGTVFVVILLLRLVWSMVAYFQTSRSDFGQGGS